MNIKFFPIFHSRLIVTPTDETKIKEETPDADQDVEMKEEEVNATETTAAIPETDVEVKAEIDDSASLATSNVEDQGMYAISGCRVQKTREIK